MILQQYYTSTDKPLHGSEGFAVRAQSAGISQAIERVLSSAGAYYHPGDLPDNAVDEMPVAFSFFAIGDGQWGITHSTYVGHDYSQSRYGNYFAHSVVCSEADLQAIDWLPIVLYGNSMWVKKETPDIPSEIPPLYGFPPQSSNILADAGDFVRQDPSRADTLGQLLQACIDSCTTAMGRRVVICDQYDNSVLWVKALTSLLPTALRKSMSFTTYQQFEHFKNGGGGLLTCVERDSVFSESQYQYDYFVFNLKDGRISPGIEPKEAAQFLAAAAKMGDYETAASFMQIFEAFECDSPAEMDVVALIYDLESLPIESVSNEVVSRVCSFLVSSKERARAICLEAISHYTQSAMLANDLNKLEILLPTFYLVAQGYADETFLDECIKFLQLQMETPSGIDTCDLYVSRLRQIEPLTRVVRDSTKVEDWVEFLRISNPDAMQMEKWLPFLLKVGEDSARREHLALWKELAEWARNHQSSVYVNAVAALLQKDRPEFPLSVLRKLVSFVPDVSTAGASDTLIDAQILLISHGADQRDALYTGDIIIFRQYLLSLRDIAEGYSKYLEKLQNEPPAICKLTEQLVNEQPSSEKQCASVISRLEARQIAELLLAFITNPTLSRCAQITIEALNDPRVCQDVLSCLLRASGANPTRQLQDLVPMVTYQLVGQLTTSKQVDEVLRSLPLITEFQRAYGYLLWTQAELAQERIILFEPGKEMAAVEEAIRILFNQREPGFRTQATTKRAYLSYRASLLMDSISTNLPWRAIVSDHLTVEREMILPSLWPEYLDLAYEAVAARKADPDIPIKFAAIYLNTLVLEDCTALHEELTSSLKKRLSGGQREKAVFELLMRLKDAPEVTARIEPKHFAQVLRILDRRTLDALNEDYVNGDRSRKQGSNRFVIWWNDCYKEATMTLLESVKNRFRGG